MESGRIRADFYSDSALNSCAISSDGETIVAGEEAGKVHFLRLEGEMIIPSPRTFRIFVSYTFSDLKAKCSALLTRVFPRLR